MVRVGEGYRFVLGKKGGCFVEGKGGYEFEVLMCIHS